MTNDTRTAASDARHEARFTEFTEEAAAELLVALYELDEDPDDYSVVPDYSGRAMYGRTCVAVTLPGHKVALLGFAAALAGIHPDALPTRTDNMGRDLIVY
jgi:hypothetical protein